MQEEKQFEEEPGKNVLRSTAVLIILALLGLLVSGLVNAYWRDSVVRTKILYEREPAQERVLWFAGGRTCSNS